MIVGLSQLQLLAPNLFDGFRIIILPLKSALTQEKERRAFYTTCPSGASSNWNPGTIIRNKLEKLSAKLVHFFIGYPYPLLYYFIELLLKFLQGFVSVFESQLAQLKFQDFR